MILIEVVLEAPVDQREAVASLARRTMAAAQKEDGCIVYRFTTAMDLPQRFVLTELWDSEQALQAHFEGEAFNAFWRELPADGSVVSSTAWRGHLESCLPPVPKG